MMMMMMCIYYLILRVKIYNNKYILSIMFMMLNLPAVFNDHLLFIRL